jgi:serine/threonine-protein kinase HipA
MAAPSSFKPGPVRKTLDVFLGQAENPVGRLIFVKDGQREFSQFAYSPQWLSHPRCFDVSPDLSRVLGYQLHKPPTKNDSCFLGALADTEPDAWGRRVIARAHAKARAKDAALEPLTELDYLAAVDDVSRIGALRLRSETGTYLRSVSDGERSTPAFLELEKILSSSRAVELSRETAEDLAYLQGKGTSLGGMRPKCTLQDSDGELCLAKFPSVSDERAVTRGEVLALHLARLAGIDSASARVVMVHGDPVAVVKRFDRTAEQQRIPYISGATMLQARRDDEHSYTEILDVMRAKCEHFTIDARQLWRRLLFNHLITNVDDHLQNIGFLYSSHNLWRLSPAFDLNPFPDKAAESKTWLSEDTGPITSVLQLMAQAFRFELSPVQAKSVLAEVLAAVVRWKEVAMSADVGLQGADLADFRPAFEHAALQEAKTLLAMG